ASTDIIARVTTFPRAPRAGVPALSHEQSSLFQPPDAVGPYRVRRVLAAGTLGPMLLVDAPDGGPALVAKLITTAAGDDALALVDALTPRVATPIGDPGLVEVTEVGIDPAGVYLIAPFVDAPTLESRLR